MPAVAARSSGFARKKTSSVVSPASLHHFAVHVHAALLGLLLMVVLSRLDEYRRGGHQHEHRDENDKHTTESQLLHDLTPSKNEIDYEHTPRRRKDEIGVHAE